MTPISKFRTALAPDVVIPLLFALVVGTVGGFLALYIGAPMPFLIGSLAISAVLSISKFQMFGVEPNLPMPFRNMFIAVIGVMIGGSFDPQLFSDIGTLWLPVLGIVVFVLLCFGVNFLIFRILAGYDEPTAFFASMPGGLIESLTLGAQAGAQVETLTLLQFSRITLVITVLPLLFLVWTGEKVGSAAGIVMPGQGDTIGMVDISILTAAAIVGVVGARRLGLPAAILIGPLVVSAIVHALGWTQAQPPVWAISGAQVVIGAGLGSRFSGFAPSKVLRALAFSALSVTLMLLIGVGLTLGLMHVVDMPFSVLFISFAPGGVTETALIAFSLNANPVFVTTMHLIRIVLTVWLCGFGFKLLMRYRG